MTDLRDLGSIPVSEWTPEEIARHRYETFNRACHPKAPHHDIMEPYMIALGAAENEADRLEIMQRGLRETFLLRYPTEQ